MAQRVAVDLWEDIPASDTPTHLIATAPLSLRVIPSHHSRISAPQSGFVQQADPVGSPPTHRNLFICILRKSIEEQVTFQPPETDDFTPAAHIPLIFQDNPADSSVTGRFKVYRSGTFRSASASVRLGKFFRTRFPSYFSCESPRYCVRGLRE